MVIKAYFKAGTKVLMADNLFKLIEDIKVGDLILYFPTHDDLIAEEISNIVQVKNFNSKVYNFSLDENHNFYANGFLSLDFICQQAT